MATDGVNSDNNCHDDNVCTQLSSFKPATCEEVSKVLSSPTKSCSLDPVPTWLLKSAASSIVPTITQLVNLSLAEGEVQASLKEALITPLLKKPNLDPHILKHYRPVSNLTYLSKVMERTVVRRLRDHLEESNLHEVMQSAYKRGHSTESALLRVQNDLLMSVDGEGAAALVLLDLSAAFDTVDHSILLSLLETRIGITDTALQWIASYLSNRHQSVVIKGETSAKHPLLYGVPQGSVLGPIFFTLYTLPIGDIVRKYNLKFHLYADDSQIYIGFRPLVPSSITSTHDTILACVEEIRTWMSVHFLQLNPDKTELIIFSSKPTLTKFQFPSLMIGNCEVHPCSHVRNLGVIFESPLTIDRQTNAICRSSYYHLRNIGHIKRHIGVPAVKTLVNALVTTRIDYCNSLLYGASEQALDKLQRVQNSAARLISGTKRHDHITPVLRELHWLPVRQRIKFKILVFVFKALHGLAPEYISELLVHYKPTRHLRHRPSRMLEIPATRRKTFGDRSFSKVGPLLWNNLPETLQRLTDLHAFKRGLKTHLFDSGFA